MPIGLQDLKLQIGVRLKSESLDARRNLVQKNAGQYLDDSTHKASKSACNDDERIVFRTDNHKIE